MNKITSRTGNSTLVLCADLNGKEIQKRGDICICIADSPYLTEGTNNIVRQLDSNKKKFFFFKSGSLSPSKAYTAAAVLFKCSFFGSFQCGTEFTVENTFENFTRFSVAGP